MEDILVMMKQQIQITAMLIIVLMKMDKQVFVVAEKIMLYVIIVIVKNLIICKVI